MFDRKCNRDTFCWYCRPKCDVYMLDSTAGLTSEDRERRLIFQFCDQKCADLHSLKHSPSLSWKKPLKKVTFSLIPTYNNGKFGEIKSIHLWNLTLSSYDEGHQFPICTAVDIFKIEEGNDQVSSGSMIALFDVRANNCQEFGEFFLTDELNLERPLPHVTKTSDFVPMVNDFIREAIRRSDSLSTKAADTENKETHSEDSTDESLV